MSALFVTGAGTGVGKTFVAGLIVRQLRGRGVPVQALKPIVTGFDDDTPATSDTVELLDALGLAPAPAHVERLSPWRFRAALAPDAAAAREQRSVPFEAVVDYCRHISSRGITIIEGVGGVMAPVDATRTVVDWIAALGSPAVLVTGSYLGAISHTLTALSVLRARGLPVRGVAVSQSADEPMPLNDTVAAIERRADGVRVVAVPRLADFALAPDLVERLDLEPFIA